jgi:hydrogenase large subunit
MARGIEALLVGRDPRDATYVTERICGVCFGAHGWTSCLAVETAHGTNKLPEAARLLRNLIVGACWLHDHPLHFYHLSALDYLDLTVLADYEGSDTYIQKIRDLAVLEITNPPVEGEHAGPLLPHYAYDAFCINDLDLVVHCVQSYLDALVMQVKAKKMSAMFAGKQPHQSGMVVGGVTQLPSLAKISEFRDMLNDQIDFINNVYVSDVVTLGTGPLLAVATSQHGVGHQNYLAYGGFPESNNSFTYPEGAIVNGTLVASNRATIEAGLSEDITSSFYQAGTGGDPAVTPQIFDLDKAGAHSFVKAPRFNGNPMEVGPLARMMVAINRPEHPAHSHPATQQLISLVNAGVQPGTVARHAARALETQILCDRMLAWLDDLETLIADGDGEDVVMDHGPGGGGHGGAVKIHDTAHWDPPQSSDVCYGMTEAPRGALAHWVKIDDYKIGHYACVVPTTWNASPTDAGGNKGPYEQALMSLSGIATPLNIVRVIRAFDPCIACAVHVIKPDGDVEKYMIDV